MISIRTLAGTILHPVAMAVLLTGTVEAQTVGWFPVGYSTSPSPRADAGIAYDEATHSTVLFGGADGSTVLGDTWIWDGAWGATIPAASPSPRQGPAIAFDGAAGNVVLFGGSPTVPVGTGTAFGDTWTWDGTNWTQQIRPYRHPHGCGRTWYTSPLREPFCFLPAPIRPTRTIVLKTPGCGTA